MTRRDAAIAVNRFGLGAKPGEIDTAAGNPKRWLLEQIDAPYVEPAEFKGFLTSAQQRENYFYRYKILAPGLRVEQDKAKAAGDDKAFALVGRKIQRQLGGYVTWVAENFVHEYGARTNLAMTTDQPFRERLVRFWSNHLVVPAIKQQSDVLCGAYEREVIRPHATGKFGDMLLVSAKNPGMQVFLDNYQSVGPNSPFGQTRKFGLNENLAREILELHTMGVEGGYTQVDVIQLAKGITGWGTWPVFGYDDQITGSARGAPAGSFIFRADWHEPGDVTVVGKTYRAGGVEQGEAILHDLARKPATARFLATKLARHFVADEPPPELVDRLAKVYLAHDTSLAEMTRALVESPEAWAQAQSKLKQPEDYAISSYRALGSKLGDRPLGPQTPYNFDTYNSDDNHWAWLASDPFNVLKSKDPGQFTEPRQKLGAEIAAFYGDVKSMGQVPWRASGPQGWYDRWSDWSGADSMLKRVEWSLTTATRHADRVPDANKFLAQSLGELASPDLKTSVARAATTEQAIGLALASPDFQRR